MKAKTIVISILIIIICAQFYLLVRQTKLERFIKVSYQPIARIPTEVYVAGMTKAIYRNRQVSTELLFQNKWLMRHLGKCIELLEAERGLEPIPIKQMDSLFGMPVNLIRSLHQKDDSALFCTAYQKPPEITPEDANEAHLNTLTCILNLHQGSLNFSMVGLESQIENYQERLQRLDPNKP